MIVRCLLVDRWDPDTAKGESTLFADPRNGAYTRMAKPPFGKEVHLPGPFDPMLDTSGFPA
ncbi:hypothetical protein HNR06_001484 [Nocardiopsis arvandica]|uniref:Uncharacterized protein n=1 Tax=Nocardiopsis sinuspersici TaxID=501010 RepID=A0A7Y9XBS8_9ACTN|nr:hypothetical protein [Nocardiopsis sinuspersici]NYH51895.1 hypothetical protein [Nocardiopsis sinuspersici]